MSLSPTVFSRYWKAQPLKEYDIYVPLSYNDGRPVEPEKLGRLRDSLLAVFGGVTFFPQENEGYWQMGDIVFRDRIVIFRVLAHDAELGRAFLRGLKEELKADLEQEEILIVEKDAAAL